MQSPIPFFRTAAPVVDDLIRWIEARGVIALAPFQRRFLRGAFAPGVSVAGLCAARGSGKTALCAHLAAAAISPDSPLHVARAEVLAVARDTKQAGQIFRDVQHILRDRMGAYWRNRAVGNEHLEHKETGARLSVLSSTPEAAHGRRPVLVVGDEPAMWRATKVDEMVAVLESSLGKAPGSRAVYIGTRPAERSHFFDALLRGEADYAQLHAAREGDPPWQRRTWERANPLLRMPGQGPMLETIRNEVVRAKGNRVKLAEFEAYRLNLGRSGVAERLVVTEEEWRQVETPDAPPREGAYVLGVDLAGSGWTGYAAAWVNGRTEAFAVAGGAKGVRQWEKDDMVRAGTYRRFVEDGELVLQAGLEVPDVDYGLREVLRRWGVPDLAVADRWRLPRLRDGFNKVGIYPRLAPRGQGWQDSGPDCEGFIRAVLNRRISPVPSRIVRFCVAGARIESDHTGAVRLARRGAEGRRARHRDDPLAALILAVAAMRRERATLGRPTWRSLGVIR